MKTLMIGVILGALGYYIFLYNPTENQMDTEVRKGVKQEQDVRDELDIEEKTYEGAFTETYDNIKNTINSAKDSVSKIEERNNKVFQE